MAQPKEGLVPFAEFMAEALYGPEGYYTRGVNFLTTPPRDFTTAPELTPLFGATLANWVAKQWQQAGEPKDWVLSELGPGRGSLMRALLTQLREGFPACFSALQAVRLVEISPTLQRVQQQTLQDFPHCQWHRTLERAEAWQLVIGNEVLDALPVQPFKLVGTQWQTLFVKGADLVWQDGPPPPLPADWQPTDGAVLEHMPVLPDLLKQIAQADVALLIDYGYDNLPASGADTLQALHQHTKVPLLHAVGDTDLTAHVNFAEVVHLLGPQQCTLTPLADFLLAEGLTDLALPLLPHPATESALQRLLHPNQMGTLHKVLCYTRSTR